MRSDLRSPGSNGIVQVCRMSLANEHLAAEKAPTVHGATSANLHGTQENSGGR